MNVRVQSKILGGRERGRERQREKRGGGERQRGRERIKHMYHT